LLIWDKAVTFIADLKIDVQLWSVHYKKKTHFDGHMGVSGYDDRRFNGARRCIAITACALLEAINKTLHNFLAARTLES